MIVSIENMMQEKDYKTLRFSKTKKHSTSDYDCLVLKNCEGKEFTISFDESMQPSKRNGGRDFNNWESTNYITDMKFYEFNEFGYYALIGAETEKKAIEYYSETVSEIDEEEDGKPVEITKEDAKTKLLKICKDNEQKSEAINEFNECINGSESYLILIDGSLI